MEKSWMLPGGITTGKKERGDWLSSASETHYPKKYQLPTFTYLFVNSELNKGTGYADTGYEKIVTEIDRVGWM